MARLLCAICAGMAMILAFTGNWPGFWFLAIICGIFITYIVLTRNAKKDSTSSTTQSSWEESIYKSANSNRTSPYTQSPSSNVHVDLKSKPREKISFTVSGSPLKTERHHVAGTSFRQEAIESLGDENPIYELTKEELLNEGYEDEKIYYYTFLPMHVSLEEEPENPNDPNAIKVIVDGVHVGYIKKGSCSHIKKLLRSGNIQRVEAEIYGGKYKYLYCEYDEDKDKDVYDIEKDEDPYRVTVELKIEE